ncbi:mitochondrial import inner membrane translocase subunit TIM13 [Fusarium albosuccineum]|uniref:Mitochondrial import inner membrane translocase subunit n=1 Tax=Fusarium albosuccineum TaxID=1237068 RepID=A0A8H4LBY7_9HYPO|nr:mitochondrial import inner membrane translocase subunit TIM13 [Fusarium albosuccineum]
MDSSQVKQAVMKQVQQEANLVNARALIECVPKPGTSLSSGETSCMTSCMEKYMAAWNMVNSAYIARLKQESGH